MGEDHSPRQEWTDSEFIAHAPVPPSHGGSIHDPACDQCRIRKVRCSRQYPKCSNCKKAKVPCSFSNKGKRVNHTMELVNNVVSLGERMEKIESTIMRWANATEQHLSATSSRVSSPDPTTALGNPNNRPSPTSQPTKKRKGDSLGLREAPVAQRQNSRSSVRDISSQEGDLAPGSATSIWTEIISSTEKLLVSGQQAHRPKATPNGTPSPSRRNSAHALFFAGADTSLQSALQQTLEILNQDDTEPPQMEETNDNSAITLPPRFILDVFVDPFVKELNPNLPVFAIQSLLEAIQAQYEASPSSIDLAWAANFNNIIIQTLTARAGCGGNSAQGLIDDSLKATFLTNAQRCCTRVEKFLKPRVANVQALLSMALTALRNFRHSTFEMLFSLACQTAKAIGLHQQSSSTDIPDGPEIERINLFWTLFILDKQLAMKSGQNCHLHSFDCDVPLPASETVNDGPLHDQRVAAIGLAFVNESIYRDLYSAKSNRMPNAQRERKVDLLMQKLDDWTSKHQNLWGDQSTRSAQKGPSGQELHYAMLTSRIMIVRRSQNSAYKTQQASYAHRSLEILKDMFEASTSIASNIALEHMLLHYPLAAFSSFYRTIAEDMSSASPDDINLLIHIASCIRTHLTSSHSSYISKLKATTSLCSSVCSSIKAARGISNAVSNTPEHAADLFPTFEDASSYGEGLQSWFHSTPTTDSPPLMIPSSSSSSSRESTARPPRTPSTMSTGGQFDAYNSAAPSFWETSPYQIQDEQAFNVTPMADVPPTSATTYAAGAEGGWDPDFRMDFDFGQYMTGAGSKGQPPVMMEAEKEDLEFLAQANLLDFH